MNYSCIPILVLVTFLSITSYGQIKPTYTPFKGEVFEIPMKEINRGFTPHFKDYPKIGDLEWTEINVPERYVNEGFPDVSREDRFLIHFESTITISQEGCYEFSLKSDDGSLLWINDKLIVNNTGKNQRIGTVDTTYLARNSYPLRIWYSQIYPDRHGIVFNSRKVEGDCSKKFDFSRQQTATPAQPTSTHAKTITLAGTLLFETNAFVLKEEAHAQLNALCAQITAFNPETIQIIGHTDNVGQFDDNLHLSSKRAAAVKAYFQANMELLYTTYLVLGKGDQKPIASNDTPEGRQKNRRVEIIME